MTSTSVTPLDISSMPSPPRLSALRFRPSAPDMNGSLRAVRPCTFFSPIHLKASGERVERQNPTPPSHCRRPLTFPSLPFVSSLFLAHTASSGDWNRPHVTPLIACLGTYGPHCLRTTTWHLCYRWSHPR